MRTAAPAPASAKTPSIGPGSGDQDRLVARLKRRSRLVEVDHGVAGDSGQQRRPAAPGHHPAVVGDGQRGVQRELAAMLLAMEDGFRLHQLIDPDTTPADSFLQAVSVLQQSYRPARD
jgi:hypothetical protein